MTGLWDVTIGIPTFLPIDGEKAPYEIQIKSLSTRNDQHASKEKSVKILIESLLMMATYPYYSLLPEYVPHKILTNMLMGHIPVVNGCYFPSS